MHMAELTNLLREIRACRVCAATMPHEPRPVIQASSSARLLIVGQAPGTRVHASGRPFTDPSGDRLRDWLGLDDTAFYDEATVAIAPMGFCFPGLDARGGDLPPRKECAPLWQDCVRDRLANIKLTLLVGAHAQKFHLKGRVKKSLTQTVAAWRDYLPAYFPTPHPSWRNNHWLRKNAWFEAEAVPELRRRVRRAISS